MNAVRYILCNKKAKQYADTDTSIEHASQSKDVDNSQRIRRSSDRIEIEKAKEDMI